jgi:hypothetical protein
LIKTVNPLNVLEVRKVDYCPPYFHSATFTPTYNIISTIENWIYNNTKGRYYIAKTVYLNTANEMGTKLKIAFENPRELTYFTLACPHLKYYT